MPPPLPKWASAASGETGRSISPRPHAPSRQISSSSSHLCRASCAPPSTWSRSGKRQGFVMLDLLEVELVGGGEGATNEHRKGAQLRRDRPDLSEYAELATNVFVRLHTKERGRDAVTALASGKGGVLADQFCIHLLPNNDSPQALLTNDAHLTRDIRFTVRRQYKAASPRNAI